MKESPPQEIIKLDSQDPSYKKLTELARRLEVLVNKPHTANDPDVQSTLDFFLGALYGLNLAVIGGYEHRPLRSAPDLDAIKERSALLTKGEVRVDGKWMAGFHFNSAMLRLSAVYHRTLKVLTGNTDPDADTVVKDLLEELRPLYKGWTRQAWTSKFVDRIHGEVNTLKHVSDGLFDGRNVKLGDALGGAEEIVRLWEAWPKLK